MNKFSIGFSILSTLLIGAGCTDEPSLADEPETGMASFALSSGIYAIDAVLDINTSPGGVVVVDDATTVAETATLDADLAPGDYAAAIVSWTFFRTGTPLGTNIAPNAVVFLGFDPPVFEITSGDTTAVNMTFQIGTSQTVTVSTDGEANFVLIANDEECEPSCVAGTVCAVINAEPASCATSCTTPADVDTEDCDGAACLEGTGGNVCEPA